MSNLHDAARPLTLGVLAHLGWDYSKKQVDNFLTRLEAEGFAVTEDGDIVSPGGMQIGDALASWWGESAPNAQPHRVVLPSEAQSHGQATGVFAAQAHEQRIESKIGTAPPGARNEAWRKPPLSVEAVCQHHGISVAQFNAESLDQRVALTNAADGARRGFA